MGKLLQSQVGEKLATLRPLNLAVGEHSGAKGPLYDDRNLGNDFAHAEFVTNTEELFDVINSTRILLKLEPMDSNRTVVLLQFLYKTAFIFRNVLRSSGERYMDSHLFGVMKNIVEVTGRVSLTSILAALLHDMEEDLEFETILRELGVIAEGQTLGEWIDQQKASSGIHPERPISKLDSGEYVIPRDVFWKFFVDADNLKELLDGEESVVRRMISSMSRQVSRLVHGATKVAKAKHTNADSETSIEDPSEATYYKLLQVALSDVTVLYVKLADRLHNMSTLDHLPREKQIAIAQETQRVYIPIARILRLKEMEEKLVDLTMKILNPGLYEEVKKLTGDKMEARLSSPFTGKKGDISSKEKIERAFTGLGDDFEVRFKPKSIVSIIGDKQQPYELLLLKELNISDLAPLYDVELILKNPNVSEKKLKEVAEKIKRRLTPLDSCESSLKRSSDREVSFFDGWIITIQSPCFGGDLRIRVNTLENQTRRKRGLLPADFADEKGHSDVPEIIELQDRIKIVLEKYKKGLGSVSDLSRIFLWDREIKALTKNRETKIFPRGATGLDFAVSIHPDVMIGAQGIVKYTPKNLQNQESGEKVLLEDRLEDGCAYVVESCLSGEHPDSKNVKASARWLPWAGHLAKLKILAHLGVLYQETGGRDRLREMGKEYVDELGRIFKMDSSRIGEICGNQAEIGMGKLDPLSKISGFIEKELGIQEGESETVASSFWWNLDLVLPNRDSALKDFHVHLAEVGGINIDGSVEEAMRFTPLDDGRTLVSTKINNPKMSTYDFLKHIMWLRLKGYDTLTASLEKPDKFDNMELNLTTPPS
jgi:hypothetical protein